MKASTSLLGGSFLFVIFYILNSIFRFSTSVIVARTLGVEGKGIYALTLLASALAILLVNPGLHTALVFYTSKGQFPTVNQSVLGLYLALGISLVGGGLLYGLYHFGIVNQLLTGVTDVFLGFVLLSIPLNLGALYLSSILLGHQRILEFNFVECLRLGSNLCLQGISAWLGGGLNGAVFSWLAANIVALLAATWFLRKELIKPWHVPVRVLQPAFSYGIRNYPVNLLNFINTRLDAFLVNIFAGVSQVGLYSTSASVAEMLWFIPNAFGNTLFSKIPALKHNEANDLVAQACRQSILVMLVTIMLSAFGGPLLIKVVFGTAFSPASIPFLWLLPGVLGLGVSRVLAADFNGRGKPQLVTLAALVAAGLTLTLDLALIPKYGMRGAAQASSLAYLANAMILVFWSRKQNNLHWNILLIPKYNDVLEILQFCKGLIVRLLGRWHFLQNSRD